MPDSPQDLLIDDDEMKRAQADLADAQRRVEELRVRNRAKALADVRERIQMYGLTAEELGFEEKAAKKTTAKPAAGDPKVPSKVTDGRSVVQTKYIGPNGEKWSGRGKNPAWLVEQISKGKKKEDFSVNGATTKAGDHNG